MYRKLLLDFMLFYKDQLIQNQCFGLTFVFFHEKAFDLKDVCGLSQEISVYHAKESYIFEKHYDTSKIDGTLVEVGLDATEPFQILTKNISYSVNDPYYFRDLREFKANSITVFPFFRTIDKKNTQLSGMMIAYSHIDTPNLSFSNQRFLTLQKKLIEGYNQILMDHIKDVIMGEENFQIVVKSKQMDAYFCNNSFKEDNRLISNYIDDAKSHSGYLLIKKQISNMHKYEESDYTIYYQSKRNSINQDLQIEYLDLASINHHSFSSPYALVYLRSIDEIEEDLVLSKKLCTAMNTICPDALYKMYKVDEYAICEVINQEIAKKKQMELGFQLKKRYFQVINIPKDVAAGVDLNKVISYIHQTLPETFHYDAYTTYLNQLNQAKLVCDAEYPKKEKVLIAAENEKTIGEILIDPIENYYDLAIYKVFEQSMISKMESVVKKTVNNPVFTILVHSFTKRKVQEVLKKVINKYPTCKLILHLPPIIDFSSEKLFEIVHKLKELGFVLIADSTIFMNLNYSIALKEIDAVLIRESECRESISSNNPYNLSLINSYYDEGKVVVFGCIPNPEDAPLINPLTCLIVER